MLSWLVRHSPHPTGMMHIDGHVIVCRLLLQLFFYLPMNSMMFALANVDRWYFAWVPVFFVDVCLLGLTALVRLRLFLCPATARVVCCINIRPYRRYYYEPVSYQDFRSALRRAGLNILARYVCGPSAARQGSSMRHSEAKWKDSR